ncbi:MAG: hypothetical protein HFI39_03430 [Lachnospiraceae bacterium]|nr:hypothetical protein [Lachnospiraceae bacterium]
MGTYYMEWLEQEKKWMSDYRRRSLRMMTMKVLPATAIILGVLFGLMGFLGGTAEEAIMMAVSGVILGLFITGVIVLCMLPGLRAGRMEKGIRKAIKQIGMDEREQEELAREMLKAARDAGSHMDFQMTGPGSNGTPASVLVSPRFAYMRGGTPLVNLVRLSDCEEICRDEEQKTMTQSNGRRRTIYRFTLYTIGFYLKGITETSAKGERLYGAAMGFFSQQLRDEAYEMIVRRKH